MLPSSEVLTQINHKIQATPNRQGEYKKSAHYNLFLLCSEAGLRVSEAVNFDLKAKTPKGLYRVKSKGKKERYVYIPQKVIKELKKNNWQPNQTNRWNFYHFLRKIKKDLGISQNTELTPHTLRRAFTTYHAENGLPLPLLQKLLGHKSIRKNYSNLINAYQQAVKDKEKTQKQLNHLLETIKTAAKQFHHWQKINYYQQLEKQNELKAQILQPNPPPWQPR